MQIMPATGREIAKRLGLKRYRMQKLQKLETNIKIGTFYMKLLIEKFNHPVLATAAYNAGPGRVRRWQSEKELDVPIFVENIPITETRNFVMRVFFNTFRYSQILGNSPQIRDSFTRLIPRR